MKSGSVSLNWTMHELEAPASVDLSAGASDIGDESEMRATSRQRDEDAGTA